MKKARFNYYGYLSLGGQVLLLILFCLVLIFGILSWQLTTIPEKPTFLFVMLAFISIIIWIVSNLVDKLKQLVIKDDVLILTNLFRQNVQKVPLKELAEVKRNGLTLTTELINLEGEVIAQLYHPFYQDLNEFFLENNVKIIGRDERCLRGLII